MPDPVSQEELQLATRNHGMPLEALRWDVTPVGLHYLLVHYDVPLVDLGQWRLEVHGRKSLSLSLDDLRRRETVTHPVTMECAGNGRARLHPRPVSQPWLHEAVGTGMWTGTPLRGVLEEVGIAGGAVEVLFTGMDAGIEGGVPQSYARALPLADALRDEVLLVWGLNGNALPPQHGFPLRLVVPGWYGMTNVKWLARIELLHLPYDGYQHERSYRLRAHEDDPGVPVTRMMPRALLVPPGVPDFMTRVRHVEAGRVVLEGRAWSGWGDIAGVTVSTDGGETWVDAELEPADGPYAWRRFRLAWRAQPGEHVLCCRARDVRGNQQPLTEPWNVGGYANNAVQRIPVVVRV
jgi:DMSO/TMAO reductase YedYZ molybdopterin-dependent catalytic subunit